MKKASFDSKKIAQICNALIEAGREPTIKAVTDKLGGGSPNLVLKYIQAWRKEHELASNVEDDLSPEFRQAVLAECARKLASMRMGLQEQIKERDSQLNELQGLLENAETQVEELNNELAQMKKDQDAKYIDYEAKLASLREQIAVRTEQGKEVKEKLYQQTERLQEQLKQLQEAKHQADIRAAAAEARNAELEKLIHNVMARA
jgi:chromosome segregation ATPase